MMSRVERWRSICHAAKTCAAHDPDVSSLVTIYRRLAALSSLFQHLVRYRLVRSHPVREIARPAINRWEGLPPTFTPQQARALLDAPDPATVPGLRDWAIFAVGLQVG